MKNFHATHEWTKKFFYENQPCYERLETLVTQKPAIGGENDFASTDYLWEDTSLKLADGDIITFHITDVANGGEDYISVPLYCDNSISAWGDEGFDTNLGGAWFGYNGIVDENNLYIGVRLVVPQLFNGTVEIGRPFIKQLDEKFVSDSIKYTDTPIKIGEGISMEKDIIPGIKNFTIDTYTYGPPEEEAVIGNNSGYCITIFEKIPVEYAMNLINKPIQILDISSYNETNNIITTNILGIGEDYSTLFLDGNTFPSPRPFRPTMNDKIYSANLVIECSEEIKEGDKLLFKGYFPDSTEQYTIVVPKLEDGSTIISKEVGKIGKVDLTGTNHNIIVFNYGEKGIVYKLDKKPISEATTELYGIVKEIDEALDRVIEKYGLGELTLEKLLADNPTAIGNYPTMEISAGKYKVLGCVSNKDSTLYTDKDLIIHCALYPVGSSPEDETILSLSQTFTIDTDSVLEYPYIDDNINGIEVTIYIVKVGDA